MHMCKVWWPGSVCWQQPVSVKYAKTIVFAAFRVQAGLDDETGFRGDQATIRCVDTMVCVAFGGP